MTLTLIVSDNCDSCDRSKIVLKNIQTAIPGLEIEILHINSYKERRISITPALLINSKLFSYGDIDEQKLLAKLN